MEPFEPIEPEVTPDKPEWQQLELLVAAIQKQLAPNATITHNAKLPGALTERMRQIDVLVEEQIGQYTMRIVIDCKDYNTKVDVKGVEEFHGMLKDVGANKGALVCPAGFSKNAKILAQKLRIDLYSPADTNPHKWQVRFALPVLCDFRATTIAFGISTSAPLPLKLPQDFYKLPVFGPDDRDLGSFIDVATRRWEDGELPNEPGEHDHVQVFDDI